MLAELFLLASNISFLAVIPVFRLAGRADPPHFDLKQNSLASFSFRSKSQQTGDLKVLLLKFSLFAQIAANS